MKMIKILVFIVFLLSKYEIFGQKRCASRENYPEKSIFRYKNQLQNYEDNYKVFPNIDRKLIKIPVVVHVIHNNRNGVIGGNNNSNISDDQIFSQIKVLNEDYRRKSGTLGFNSSDKGEDMAIEFFLATRDPSGKPSTGINRVYNSKRTFDVFNDNFLLSNLSYWDSNKYLNIWVTSLADDYLGFAEFPTGRYPGLELEEIDEKIDGIMIDHTAFGKRTGTANNGIYVLGRTLTHEIGHWLGLLHTWGDEYCGDDFVSDTPTTEKGNLTLNCDLRYSNCNNTRSLNMIENFMDYSPDTCMNIFTIEQANRVRNVLELSLRRKKLIENTNKIYPKVNILTVKMLENPTKTDVFRFEVLVKQAENVDFEVFDLLGRKVYEYNNPSLESSLQEINKSLLPKGILQLRIKTQSESETRKILNE